MQMDKDNEKAPVKVLERRNSNVQLEVIHEPPDKEISFDSSLKTETDLQDFPQKSNVEALDASPYEPPKEFKIPLNVIKL